MTTRAPFQHPLVNERLMISYYEFNVHSPGGAMRHLFYFAFSFVITTQSAFAELSYCDDLWFTRNLILNRAGECIITPQAEALFDNSDCLLTGAIMSISEAERVNAICHIPDGSMAVS